MLAQPSEDRQKHLDQWRDAETDAHDRVLKDDAASGEDLCVSEFDPTSRALAALRPPESASPAAPAVGIDPVLLEQAARFLLRNISWGRAGDRTVVQLRLGVGRFADAEITLESNRDRRVTVRIGGAADAELVALENTLRTRLEGRGLAIEVERSTR